MNEVTKLRGGGGHHKQMTDRAMVQYIIFTYTKNTAFELTIYTKNIICLMQICNFLVCPKEDSSSNTE